MVMAGCARTVAVICALGWSLAPVISSARDCVPYNEPTSPTLSVWLSGSADISEVKTWPGISIADSVAHADVVWDPRKGYAYDAGGRLISEKISNVCALSAVISQTRATFAVQQLANTNNLDLFTVPGADGLAYDREKVGITVSPRSSADRLYITVFDITGDGAVSLLYPVGSDGAGLVERGHFLKLSDIVVSKPFGSDHFVAIATTNRAVELREALEEAVGRVWIMQGVYYSDALASHRNVANIDASVVAAVRQVVALGGGVSVATATMFTAKSPNEVANLRRATDLNLLRSILAGARSRDVRQGPQLLHAQYALAEAGLGGFDSISYSSGREPRASRITAAEPDILSDLVTSSQRDPAHTTGAKLALVIGNSDYQSANTLPNPKNDASELANLLRQEGFRLVGDGPQVDLTIAKMEELLRATYSEARPSDSLFVFYAGHGVQFRGHNYLIPVDAKLDTEADLDVQAIKLEDVFHAVAPAQRRLIVLDACRTPPFPLRGANGQGRGLSVRGLALEYLPRTLVAYSTLPGHTASDGSGNHSPYAAALLLHLREPHKSARQILNEVYEDFSNSLGNGHIAEDDAQLPMFEDLMGTEEFYF